MKNKKVVLGVSGGIDSLVLAILIGQTIGNNLLCLLVDSGFNRPEEAKQVNKFLEERGVKLEIIRAKNFFLKGLNGRKSSQDKKGVIKDNFAKIFNGYALRVGADFIAHGTNKDDSELLFERNKELIKNTKIKNLEPLIGLNKSQIKNIAKFLKLPDEVLNKYPLSSWGLARRIIGEVTKKKLNYISKADNVFINYLKKEKIYKNLKNAVVCLYPYFGEKNKYFIILKTIGKRGEPIMLSADLIKKVSLEITKIIPSVGRVVYDVSVKEIIGSEWE